MNDYKIHRKFNALSDYYRLRDTPHKEDQNPKKETSFYSRKRDEWQDQSEEESGKNYLQKLYQNNALKTPP